MCIAQRLAVTSPIIGVDNWCQFVFLSDNCTDTNSDQQREVAADARNKPRKQRKKKQPVRHAARQVSHRPGRPWRSGCAPEALLNHLIADRIEKGA